MTVGGDVSASASDSPGLRILASVPGASWPTSSANVRAGMPGSSRHHTIGAASVPQWIGTAMRGRSSGDGARRALGIEVPGPDLRSPAPDRHERDVELAGEVAHPVEEIGVAEERHARAALDDVAHGRRVRPDGEAAPVVLDGDHPHAQLADLQALAGHGLDDLVARPAAHQVRADGRRDHGHAGGEPAQRGQVEVVVVGVGDQHRGEAVAGRRRGRRRDAADVADPRAQQRVGEQARAVDLDPRGGVADVGDGVHRPTQARRGSRAITRMRRCARRSAGFERGFWTSGQFFIEKAYVLIVFAGVWALLQGVTEIVNAFRLR